MFRVPYIPNSLAILPAIIAHNEKSLPPKITIQSDTVFAKNGIENPTKNIIKTPAAAEPIIV